MTSHGTDILFITMIPIAYELQNCKHIDLINVFIEWNPNYVTFPNGLPKINEHHKELIAFSMAAQVNDSDKVDTSHDDLNFLKTPIAMEFDSSVDVLTPRISFERHNIGGLRDDYMAEWLQSNNRAYLLKRIGEKI